MADTTNYASRLLEEPTLEAMLAEHRREGIFSCATAWDRATRCQKFANGDQTDATGKKDAETGNAKRKGVSLNEIGPVLQTLAGRQMMQRFAREYLPRNSSAARRAEAMTAIDRAMMEACDAEQVESAAFKDGPGIQGVSWVRIEYDTLERPDGWLKYSDIPVWQMMWPRGCRKVNLSDRPWHRFGTFMHQREVKARWGDAKYTKIAQNIGAQGWATMAPGKSSRTPWAGGEGNQPLANAPYYDPAASMLWIEYEEWREVIEMFTVAIPIDGGTYANAMASALPGQDSFTDVLMDKQQVKEFKAQHLAANDEEVPADLIAPSPRLEYRFAYICGEEILETGPIPTGYFTFLAITGFRYPQPENTDWIGLVERLIDAQKWNNVLLSALILNLQLNPKGLFIYEQGLFRSKKEAFHEFTSPGGTIEVPRGKLSGGGEPYRYLAGGTQSYTGMVESLFGFYREAIPRLAGFNPGALGQLGSDLRRISGEVVRSVQDAAMTSNAELFDSLRLFKRECGRVILAFLATFWGDRPEELVDIVGEELAYEDVIDPATGAPAVDPMTGEPMRTLLLDPADWHPNAWKSIQVEEVVPTGDALQALWESLSSSGALQILLQPQPDTGQPLFSSEDLAEIIPRIPAPRREKMIQRIKAAAAAVAAQPPAAPPAGEEALAA